MVTVSLLLVSDNVLYSIDMRLDLGTTTKHYALLGAGCLVAVAVLLVVGVKIIQRQPSISDTMQAPQQLRAAIKSVSFPLYYPSWVPQGFSYDMASSEITPTLVIFSFRKSGSQQQLVVTEQPASVGFDFSRVEGDIHTIAFVGTAYIITNKNFQGAGIRTEKTSIFINEPVDIGSGDFAAFVESFRRI